MGAQLRGVRHTVGAAAEGLPQHLLQLPNLAPHALHLLLQPLHRRNPTQTHVPATSQLDSVTAHQLLTTTQGQRHALAKVGRPRLTHTYADHQCCSRRGSRALCRQPQQRESAAGAGGGRCARTSPLLSPSPPSCSSPRLLRVHSLPSRFLSLLFDVLAFKKWMYDGYLAVAPRYMITRMLCVLLNDHKHVVIRRDWLDHSVLLLRGFATLSSVHLPFFPGLCTLPFVIPYGIGPKCERHNIGTSCCGAQ